MVFSFNTRDAEQAPRVLLPPLRSEADTGELTSARADFLHRLSTRSQGLARAHVRAEEPAAKVSACAGEPGERGCLLVAAGAEGKVLVFQWEKRRQCELRRVWKKEKAISVTGTEGLTGLKMSAFSLQTVCEGLGGARPNVGN